MERGDKIRGKIYYKKNNDNFRNIDVRIDYEVKNKFGEIKETEYFLFQ